MVSVSAWEGRKIARYMVQNEITPLRQGLTCPFFQDSHCAIYPVRPVICRLYGHIPDPRMTCPHGYNVDIKPHLIRRIHEEYNQSIRGGPLVLIHKLVYSDEECRDLWKAATAPNEPPSSLLSMVPATPPEAAAKSSPEDNSNKTETL